MTSTNVNELRKARAVFEDQSASGEQLAERMGEIAANAELLSLYREHVAELFEKLERLATSNTSEMVMSTTRAAQVLGMSVPTLRKIARAGEIAYHLVGTHMRFEPEDVKAYQARRQRGFEAVLEIGAMFHDDGLDDDYLDDIATLQKGDECP